MFDCIVRDVTDEKKCVICLDGGSLKNYSSTFECNCSGNLFHKKCWRQYEKKFNTCPLCRKKAASIVVNIQPLYEERATDDDNICYSPQDNHSCIGCIGMLNFVYRSVVFAYIITGMISSRTYDPVYVTAGANAVVTLVEIALSCIDCLSCAYGQFYMWARKYRWRWNLLSFGVVFKFTTLICTMLFVREAQKIYEFRVGFVMAIVHFTATAVVFILIALKRTVIHFRN
jgi:hypothetical protein